MTRVDDFEVRLARVLDEAQARPFDLGAHDCITFAFRGIQTLGGPDLLAMTPGGWTARTAPILLHFFGGLPRAVSAYAIWSGLRSIAPRLAHRGDLVVIEAGGEPAAGLLLGAEVAVVGPDGLARVPRSTIIAGWCW